jgi:hypothetical protein
MRRLIPLLLIFLCLSCVRCSGYRGGPATVPSGRRTVEVKAQLCATGLRLAAELGPCTTMSTREPSNKDYAPQGRVRRM